MPSPSFRRLGTPASLTLSLQCLPSMRDNQVFHESHGIYSYPPIFVYRHQFICKYPHLRVGGIEATDREEERVFPYVYSRLYK